MSHFLGVIFLQGTKYEKGRDKGARTYGSETDKLPQSGDQGQDRQAINHAESKNPSWDVMK